MRRRRDFLALAGGGALGATGWPIRASAQPKRSFRFGIVAPFRWSGPGTPPKACPTGGPSGPSEQPARFELVINTRAAKEVGATLSPTILARADEVIE